MHILFLLTQDLESPYGIGRFLPLAQALTKQGYCVSVAALHSNFDALTQKHFSVNDIEVHYVAPMHVKKQGHKKAYYSPVQLLWITARATLALTRAARRIPADVIHVAKPHPMNSIAGLIAKYLQDKTLFIDCDDYEAGSNRFGGKWQQMGVAFFEKTVPRLADMVTTNSHFMHENLLSWGVPHDNIMYLPNGVDPKRFACPDSVAVAQLKSELGLAKHPVVTYIGTLSLPSHPVDLLVQAFHPIREKYPQVTLLIVGGGEDFDTLQNLALDLGLRGSILFTGRVPAEEVPLYYALSDVSVDPVHDDDAARGRCPLKLFESWACGTPFVTADVGDRRSLIGYPPAGVLARPGDDESLAAAILQVLNDPSQAEAFRQRGLERVEDYFWDKLVRPLHNIYLEKI